jgi:hypothetical protein
MRLGMDGGHNYGCSEEQLLKGLCFDPCLSMKYNYGFFPGGKLLSLNRFVKYKGSRHNKLDEESEGEGGVLGGEDSNEETETTTTADPIAVHNEGARFFTQLTGDVQDEETAISKNKGSKFVRILRGPWATPYRRVRKTLIKSAVATLGDAVSNSDILNASKTTIGYAPRAADKYEDPINQKPYKKRVSSVYTDTSVSPCNSGGADHCSYVTPTLHLGIDVEIEGSEAVFHNAAIGIAGQNPGGATSGGGASMVGGGSVNAGQSGFLEQMQRFTRF